MQAIVANTAAMCDMPRMVTGTQLKMARTALGWGMRELAARSGVSANTVMRAESSSGIPNVNARTLARLKAALEDGGAEFTPDGAVRVRRP
jgi:transcriptional regulator with XRE-family HTH domain